MRRHSWIPLTIATAWMATTGWIGHADADPIRFTFGTFDQAGALSPGSATEPSIAVGPNHVFTQAPGNVQIFTKTGSLVYQNCGRLFYELGGTCTDATGSIDGGGALDPECAFDPMSQRYYALVFTSDGSSSSHIHLAVSACDDPTMGWFVYHVNTSLPPGCTGFTAIDRPILGFTADKIIVCGTSVGPCDRIFLRVFNKLALTNHSAGTVLHGTHLDLSPTAYRDVDASAVPPATNRVARNLGGGTDGYLFSILGTSLQVRNIMGTWDTATLCNPLTIVLGTPIAPYTQPVQYDPVLGTRSIGDGNGLGNHFAAIHVRHDVLTFVVHQGMNVNGTNFNGIRLFRIGLSSGLLLTDQSLVDGYGMHYAFPAAIEDSTGNVYLGFNGSSASTYPSCFVTAFKVGDTSLEQPPVQIKPGNVTWKRNRFNQCAGTPVWGDFTGMALDESVSPPVAYYIGQWSNWGGDSNCQNDRMASWVRSFYFVPSGGGGGHCPFLDTWSAGTWQEENSILGRSATGQMLLDLYQLAFPPDVAPDGTVRLRVREDEQERTRLTEAKLLAVDRNPDQVSWVHEGRVALGTRVPVAKVTSSSGEDLTGRLSDPVGQCLECAPGTILNVELYDKSAPGAGSVRIDLAGLLVRPSQKEIGLGPAKDDGHILKNSGILVQKPDGNGGWIELGTIRPREKAADLAVGAARELRLVFVGRHRIHRLAWVRFDTDTPALAELKANTAVHSAAGEVAGLLSGRVAEEVTLSPGERIEMGFRVPPMPTGKVRDYYFASRGVYTSITSGDGALAGVPKRIELYAARPNPAARSVQMSFGLPSPARVRISVFDLAGRLVSRPVDGPFEAGRHDATWDLMTEHGTRVGSGMYFYRMEVGGWRQERKLIVQ